MVPISFLKWFNHVPTQSKSSSEVNPINTLLKSTISVFISGMLYYSNINGLLDGNGVKAIPGSIPLPNPGTFNKVNKENMCKQMRQTKYT